MKLKTILNIVNRRQITSHRMFMTSVCGRQKGAEIPATAHTHGTCAIPKWEPQDQMEEIKKMQKIQLPSHLIRPPCLPGGKQGEVQTCMRGDTEGGLYCMPCRAKYKYASFSENIDFTPPKDDSLCWWQGKAPCELDQDEQALEALSRSSPCSLQHQWPTRN